ncbi:TPA: hypothetical protein QDC05_008439 [Burkholderia stabilis]|nr:hypothetical protein [Burkholderia stabilis]HDR9543512.1 hypothetical protein [Burkholderia stabilis]
MAGPIFAVNSGVFAAKGPEWRRDGAVKIAVFPAGPARRPSGAIAQAAGFDSRPFGRGT